MSRLSINRLRASAIVLLFLTAALTACNSPTAPEADTVINNATQLRLSSAQVAFNGQVVNGLTVHSGQMHGTSTFFQATLMGPHGPANGETVQVHYQIPGGGMGHGYMGGGEGYMQLYDDGTHGDHFAGDGIYCYDDQEGQYGFHMAGAPHGEYHYEFFGFDHHDHHSNHVSVVVTLES